MLIRNNFQGLSEDMLRDMFSWAEGIESPTMVEETNPDHDHVVTWICEKTHRYLLAVPIGKETMREWLWDLPYEYVGKPVDRPNRRNRLGRNLDYVIILT
jgi:hypothetical protein